MVQMATDNLQPLVWPSLHSELSGMVNTDECMLSHCCDIILHNIPDRDLRVVNETDWCHANLNMTMCIGDHPPVLPRSSCNGAGMSTDSLSASLATASFGRSPFAQPCTLAAGEPKS